MKYETFIFDIDGTLTDSGPAILKAFQLLLLTELGWEYALEDLDFILGLPITELGNAFSIPNWEEIMTRSSLYHSKFAHEISFFPGVEKTVRQLYARGAVLGIVTSKTRKQYEKTFAGLDLAKVFSCVICADDTPFHKPHPYPLTACLHKLNASRKTALYIGDSANDMLCAQNAGVAAALALWGNRKIPDSSGVLLLNEPEELKELGGSGNESPFSS